jgi:hypothetical protein
MKNKIDASQMTTRQLMKALEKVDDQRRCLIDSVGGQYAVRAYILKRDLESDRNKDLFSGILSVMYPSERESVLV